MAEKPEVHLLSFALLDTGGLAPPGAGGVLSVRLLRACRAVEGCRLCAAFWRHALEPAPKGAAGALPLQRWLCNGPGIKKARTRLLPSRVGADAAWDRLQIFLEGQAARPSFVSSSSHCSQVRVVL